MKYVRMKIENEFLNDANFEAWIHYSDNDKEQKIYAKIIGIGENGHFEDLLGRTCDAINEKEFEEIKDALNWIERRGAELVIRELEDVARRGRWAQEKIDCIDSMGFQL